MQVKKEITFGNLLTVISIVLAIISFLYSQQRDRAQRYALELEERRSAAASALFVIDALDESVNAFLLRISPLYVDVSGELGNHRDAERARDALWRQITLARADMETAIKEDVLRHSQRLAIIDPQLLQQTRAYIADHAQLRTALFQRLIEGTQRPIIAYLEFGLDGYRSSHLGNALRDAHFEAESFYRRRQQEQSGATREALNASLLSGRDD